MMTDDQITEVKMREAFAYIDRDNDGIIDSNDLYIALLQRNHSATPDEAAGIMEVWCTGCAALSTIILFCTYFRLRT